MVSKLVFASAVIVTATTFFLFGAYCQHVDVLRNLQKVIQNDPYAFFMRSKLYDSFRFFGINEDEYEEPTRMQQIMKYGFPSMDDVRLYSDFVLSYDRRNRVAHWVYEHLTANCLRNNAGVRRRYAHYLPDMSVPSNFRTDTTDYSCSGFDRGHLAAAGNHKCQQMHCNETFYLTNIAPQVGRGFNRDAWNKLEIYIRELTERYNSVYVCTGPLYMPKEKPSNKYCVEYQVIGPKTIAVPTHFFKVITVESKLPGGSPYMEAYVMPNAPIDSDIDIRGFLSDIKIIERNSGLQFFKGIRRCEFFGTNFKTVHELYKTFQ
ncbi:endonuclease G, mitochondrial-like [Teleopsis dalmanni]|uniref:endonuclease G, mitochondrial-like n=1 Tax=Teleopsis dalmanni TaxID=139649 RepID=UPI0018CD504B|nr:endonuclease G, mitochondrial-like [Teleopsis dalmanni]